MNEPQSQSLVNPSHPVGKDSSRSKEITAYNLRERDSNGILKAGTPEQMHRNGISVSRANKDEGAYLRAILGRELVALTNAVKVNNTFNSEEDVYQAIEDIIDEFKTLKVEEVLYVFSQIRRGKIDLFGRLDTPTICKALREYDVNVACEFREKHYKEAIEEEALRAPLFQEFIESLPDVRPTYAEILQRRSKLSFEEREAIRKRDAERNTQTPEAAHDGQLQASAT